MIQCSFCLENFDPEAANVLDAKTRTTQPHQKYQSFRVDVIVECPNCGRTLRGYSQHLTSLAGAKSFVMRKRSEIINPE
jgi:hypothetical protein